MAASLRRGAARARRMSRPMAPTAEGADRSGATGAMAFQGAIWSDYLTLPPSPYADGCGQASTQTVWELPARFEVYIAWSAEV